MVTEIKRPGGKVEFAETHCLDGASKRKYKGEERGRKGLSTNPRYISDYIRRQGDEGKKKEVTTEAATDGLGKHPPLGLNLTTG